MTPEQLDALVRRKKPAAVAKDLNKLDDAERKALARMLAVPRTGTAIAVIANAHEVIDA